MQIQPAVFADVAADIPAGSVAFYRPGCILREPCNWLIARGTRGLYAHVGLTAHDDSGKRPVLLETLQGHGMREVTLASQVEGWPGQWDVYLVDPTRAPDYNRFFATWWMRQRVGSPYGRSWLRFLFLANLPLLRLAIATNLDDNANDNANGSAPVCSQAVDAALRHGGIDPTRNLAGAWTSPNDLARSPLLVPKYRLYWTKEQAVAAALRTKDKGDRSCERS